MDIGRNNIPETTTVGDFVHYLENESEPPIDRRALTTLLGVNALRLDECVTPLAEDILDLAASGTVATDEESKVTSTRLYGELRDFAEKNGLLFL